MNMYIKMKSVEYAGKHFHKGIYHVLMSQASRKKDTRAGVLTGK